MKTCTSCHRRKPDDGFYAHRNGLRSHCKICMRKAARENALAKTETLRPKKKAYMKVYDAQPHRRAARSAYARSPRGREVYRLIKRAAVAFRRVSA